MKYATPALLGGILIVLAVIAINVMGLREDTDYWGDRNTPPETQQVEVTNWPEPTCVPAVGTGVLSSRLSPCNGFGSN
jgi:hypothetical protein